MSLRAFVNFEIVDWNSCERQNVINSIKRRLSITWTVSFISFNLTLNFHPTFIIDAISLSSYDEIFHLHLLHLSRCTQWKIIEKYSNGVKLATIEMEKMKFWKSFWAFGRWKMTSNISSCNISKEILITRRTWRSNFIY